MRTNNEKDYFEGVEYVITQPLKFKAKLAIGEDAYTSLRLKNAVSEAWDTFGAGAIAVAFAQSTAVASTFFSPAGLLAAVGIGTAVTPIGWVIAAGVMTSGTWFGVSRYLKKASSSRVTIIPDFINTPMDILALGLFKLIASLAMKIAIIDGSIDKIERNHINNYFVQEWGYDQDFVNKGLSLIESESSDFSIKELAITLAEFKKTNPDCNYEPMSKEIISLLRDIMEVDGIIDEREEVAIDRVQAIFTEAKKTSFKPMMETIMGSVYSMKGTITRIFPKKET